MPDEEKPGFADPDAAKKGAGYFGGAQFTRTLPPMDGPTLNVELSFEEALKLYVALQSAVQGLNEYNRGRKAGAERGLLLSVKQNGRRVDLVETRVKGGE